MLALVAYPHPTPTYTASAVLLVNPGANATSPGSAQEAANLAATYAGLIPTDDAIVQSVVAATGLSASQVEHDVAVTVQDGTSLLVINFTATSSAGALKGANAMARALSAPNPVSSAIPAGTVVVTKQATTAVQHATGSDVTVALGVALGALLGVILALAWERLDPRLDQAPQAAELLGIPTRLISGLSDLSASAILRQWQAESEMSAPTSGLRRRVARDRRQGEPTSPAVSSSRSTGPIPPRSLSSWAIPGQHATATNAPTTQQEALRSSCSPAEHPVRKPGRSRLSEAILWSSSSSKRPR